MHYLTVQDVIWIHLQIAKKPVKFDYAKLEEAVSYQYAYGKSKDVLSQAARFFSGFPTMSPFDSCNRAAAFVSGVTFLALNGFSLKAAEKEAIQWFDRASMKGEGRLAIELGTVKEAGAHHSTTRDVAGEVLESYSKTIAELGA